MAFLSLHPAQSYFLKPHHHPMLFQRRYPYYPPASCRPHLLTELFLFPSLAVLSLYHPALCRLSPAVSSLYHPALCYLFPDNPYRRRVYQGSRHVQRPSLLVFYCILVYNSVFRPLTDIETPPVITAAFSSNILYLHIEKTRKRCHFRVFLSFIQCGWWDLNPHEVTPARF